MYKRQLFGKTVIDPAWSFVREDGTPMPLVEYPVNRVIASHLPFQNQVLGVNRPPHGDRVWLLGATGARLNVQALVTERVDTGTVWMPFHFSGRWQGADMLAHYPKGAAPIVRGEAVNTATTYGYDSVTMMQETKTTICNIEKA